MRLQGALDKVGEEAERCIVFYVPWTLLRERRAGIREGVCVCRGGSLVQFELIERNNAKDYGETSLPLFSSWCRQVGGPQ